MDDKIKRPDQDQPIDFSAGPLAAANPPPSRGDEAISGARLPTHVVGIGASAGGLEAIERLFRAMPADTGMAFVVIQHLSPDFKSLMKELVERFTPMRAVPVYDSVRVEADTVYLLPPKKEMVIEGDRLIATDRPAEKQLSLPINLFFRSLAASWGEKAVAIVLSGTGSDGSAAAMDVREAGGLVLAQSEQTSRFDGMPRSAIETGCVDAIMPPEEMPTALKANLENRLSGQQKAFPTDEADAAEGVPTILQSLRTAYDIDFSFYKPGTIGRRIERRIALHPEHLSVEEYGRRVARDRRELDTLYRDLLIGVTRFFRDPEAFAALADKVVSNVLDRLAKDDEARVWVCGCSTGEEAYSIAILFLEAFAARGLPPRIKILATDLHRESLQVAGEGVYPEASFSEMAPALREKYFLEQGDGTYKVTANLRKSLIFSEHNVLKDPPFTRLDLVSCRNLLIYLENTAQMRALAAFHFALKIDAFLLLGASEGLGDLAPEFGEIDRHWKVFSKRRENRLLNELRLPLRYDYSRSPRGGGMAGTLELRLGRVYDALLAHYVPSGILVNEQHEAIHTFGDGARFLSVPSGKINTDILQMLEGHLRIAVMTALRNAQQQKGPITYRGVQVSQSDGEHIFDLQVTPLQDDAGNARFFMLCLTPQVASAERAAESMQAPQSESHSQIELLEDELQRARESLQSTIEELETSNEELQATNEEMLASNEELQSTNEELHSVNEELYSVNAEHELKIQELNAVTSDLNNLIRSTELATLFIDTDCRIRLFTPLISAFFPLLQQDVGRDLRHFTPTGPDGLLFSDIELALAKRCSIERSIDWANGQSYLRRITAYQDTNKVFAGLVLTYVEITETARLTQALARNKARLEAIVATNPNGLLVVDRKGELLMVNPALEGMFGYGAGELLGQSVDVLVPDLQRVHHATLRDDFMRRPSSRPMGVGSALQGRRRDGGCFPIEVSLGVFRSDGEDFVQATIVDISQRVRGEEAIRDNLALNARLASIVSSTDDAVIGCDLDGVVNSCNLGASQLLEKEPAKIVGQPLAALFPPELAGESARYLATVGQGGSIRGAETRLAHQGGGTIDVAITLSPIRDANRTTVGVSMIARDIRERRRVDRELREHSDRLEELVEQRTAQLTEANRNLAETLEKAEAATRAKSAFLANMSHEIRTPLNAILGLTHLLQREPSTDKQRERLGHIGEAGRHLLEIITNVLDLSKIEVGKVQINEVPVSPSELIGSVVAMLGDRAARQQLALSAECPPLPKGLIGDPTAIRQALLNYASNALKFTTAGSIVLRVVLEERSSDHVRLRFEVEDTGMGIDADALPRLFQPFEQADNSSTRRFGGTGLGLAITRKLAERMGGSAGADSTPGVGSRFWFTVQLRRQVEGEEFAPAVPVSSSAHFSSRDLSGAQVLLVEDEPVNRLVAIDILKEMGIEPEIAENGLQALEYVDARPYDLVLMDIQMPVMNGIEATRRIRALEGRQSRLPIIAVTANAFAEDREQCLAAGMNDFVSKPFEPEALRALIRRWLD